MWFPSNKKAADVDFFKHYIYLTWGWTVGVRFPTEARVFLYSTASRPALKPTQPSIQWVPRALSPGVKRPGREADYSLHLHLMPKSRIVELYPHSRICFHVTVLN
jgi:hypothetical protein